MILVFAWLEYQSATFNRDLEYLIFKPYFGNRCRDKKSIPAMAGRKMNYNWFSSKDSVLCSIIFISPPSVCQKLNSELLLCFVVLKGEDAVLKHLLLKNVGPASEMTIEFGPRMNVLTGDNGLGRPDRKFD